jgi:hypothetical protein
MEGDRIGQTCIYSLGFDLLTMPSLLGVIVGAGTSSEISPFTKPLWTKVHRFEMG